MTQSLQDCNSGVVRLSGRKQSRCRTIVARRAQSGHKISIEKRMLCVSSLGLTTGMVQGAMLSLSRPVQPEFWYPGLAPRSGTLRWPSLAWYPPLFLWFPEPPVVRAAAANINPRTRLSHMTPHSRTMPSDDAKNPEFPEFSADDCQDFPRKSDDAQGLSTPPGVVHPHPHR